MNFWKKVASISLFGFGFCFPRLASADPVDAECGTDAYSIIGTIPKTGTIKAVAIYACGSNASTDTLPDWWARVWDTAQQHSIPRFYKDNSLGHVLLPKKWTFLGRVFDTV